MLSHPCVTPVNQDFYARVQERSGWDVEIALPDRWKTEYGEHRPERWPRFQGQLLPLPVRLPGNIPLHFYSSRLRREIRGRSFDCIYLHHEPYGLASFQAVLAAARLDIPIGFYSAQNLMKRYPRPVAAWEQRVYSGSSFALPVTQAVADVLRAKGFTGRLEVLPLGVDLERYARGGVERATEAHLTVGYVGRLSEEKGVDTLLEALAHTRQSDIHALIVGDGPARSQLERRARLLGVERRVRWLGYVPHEAAPDSYRQMDVVAVPSKTVPNWTEQFGRVVLEALAASVPVVTSTSGELPHLVHLTGGGWTFPEGDAAALGQLLDQLRADPELGRCRGSAGRAIVEKLFDLDRLADRFVRIVSAEVRHA